jgi:hypothetical protein
VKAKIMKPAFALRIPPTFVNSAPVGFTPIWPDAPPGHVFRKICEWVGFGRIWLDLPGFGVIRARPDPAEKCWEWLDLVGFAWIGYDSGTPPTC